MAGAAAVYLAEWERRKRVAATIWYDGIPRTFEDAFPNSREFRYGSLPESRQSETEPAK